MLAAALGRGYVGRHRLVDAALGRAPANRGAEVLTLPAPAPARMVPPPTVVDAGEVRGAVTAGRSSVAPWLRVVSTPPQPDQLADTLPHPVVTLFPLPSGAPEAAPPGTSAADTAEEQVFALVDAERERATTAELARGAEVRPYRPRHTA